MIIWKPIHSSPEKTNPVDADELPLSDSAGSWLDKRITWANIKAALSAVFAVLSGKSGGQTIIGGTGASDKLVLQGTSGNGTSTATAVEVKVGNNGSNTPLKIFNNGAVTVSSAYADDGGTRILSVGNLLSTYQYNIEIGCGWPGYYDDFGFIGFGGVILFTVHRTFGITFNKEFRVSGTTLIANFDNSYQNIQLNDGSLNLTIESVQQIRFKTGYIQVGVINNSGDFGLGVNAPSARVHIIKTTEQLRIGYDETNYLSATVDSSGNLTIDTTGGTIKTPDVIENTVAGEGIILKSPDGTRYKITVANGGTLSISPA